MAEYKMEEVQLVARPTGPEAVRYVWNEDRTNERASAPIPSNNINEEGYLENRNGDKGNYALKQSSTAHVRDAYGPRERRSQSRAQCTYPNPPRAVHPRAARHTPPHCTFMPKPTAYIHAAPMPPLLPRTPHKGGQIMAAPPTSVFANGKPKKPK
ncbi:hypothetical protein C8J57DRAFT_1252308 [Mycena rebaudengoi]|nr:hypothetical protein C8J57DRAFT_1252308 [Mycena rebaudengoi]